MTIYDFEVETAGKEIKSLKEYQNQVILIVNTASKCGFTPQFAGLEELYQTYQSQGFTILGFPCNQFLGQDPGNNEEIVKFCQMNYGVSFPMFGKVAVKGKNQSPLFKYLITETDGKSVSWNFNKFLVNRQGKVIKRFASKVTPESLKKEIEEIL